jgi:hypothetical protein
VIDRQDHHESRIADARPTRATLHGVALLPLGPIGAAVDKDSGRGAKKGALIGAGVGAAAGTLYGISR